MTAADTALSGAVPIAARPKLFAAVWRNPLGAASLIVLVVVGLVGIFAPWLAPQHPNHGVLELTNSSPNNTYLLGGDGSGRDILSRLIVATRVSLISALIGTTVALVVGVIGGLFAGFYGGLTDTVGSWVTNVLMALPAFVALIALYAAVGASTQAAMVVYGLLMSPSLFRLVRNLVISVKSELYIDAARVSGLSNGRIISRHIMYAIRAPIIIQSAFIAGAAVSIQAGLEFLGLGDANEPSWGAMLSNAFANLYLAPLQLVWPGLALTLTISALALLGNALRDGLEGSAPRREIRHHTFRDAQPGDVPAANRSLLTVAGLRIAYPTGERGALVDVVKGVSLDVHVGEIVGLVGESGSGKTQTAFSILGLLPDSAVVTAGSIFVDGVAVLRADRDALTSMRGKLVGYIPQEPMTNLDPTLKVGAQLVYGVRAVTDLSKTQARKRVLDLLARVGMPDPVATFGAYPHQLSGGMAQRVLIAGAVACEPRLLIADEPTTALDVTMQAEILELIRSLQQEHRIGVLLVTHNFGVVADLCDRVFVMQYGQVVESAPTNQIFTHPQHPYTRMLLDSILSEDIVRQDLPPLEEPAR
jgi:peptide/nickel transport system permease protein